MSNIQLQKLLLLITELEERISMPWVDLKANAVVELSYMHLTIQ